MNVAVPMVLATLVLPVHEWYAPDCCGGHDCKPLDDTEVKELAGGWDTPIGIIAYGDKRVRDSLDGRYHICTGFRAAALPQPGLYSTRPLVMQPFLRCFYRPPRGM